MQSGGPSHSRSATSAAGSASAAALGSERSSTSAPSSRPQRSMLSVPGSMPIARVIARRLRLVLSLQPPLHHVPRDVGDRLGVEYEVVALEEPRDALLVHLHLEI